MAPSVPPHDPERAPALAALEKMADLPPGEVAALLSRALAEADRGELDAGGSLAADRAIVAAVRRSPLLDRVLGQIDLTPLAAAADRTSAALEAAGEPPPRELRALAFDLLDLLRRPSVLRRIPGDAVDSWAGRVLALVARAHLTGGHLFRMRAEAYGPKALFHLPAGAGNRVVTWRQADDRVDLLARGLLSLTDGEAPSPIAILSDNRIEMALVDLACFRAALVNVLLPGNATSADVGYMLGHSAARTLIVSDLEQLRKVLPHRTSLRELRHIVVMDAKAAREGGRWPTLDDISARGARGRPEEVARRLDALRIDDLATVMYTSGTTGHPKGIRFSHRNVVCKRFARALALPEIGEDDVFLCYLPLFHTFGRFLEMWGCVFWGATYCFLENPSVDALVQEMRRHRPTVFISVPKKWIEIHEAIERRVASRTASDAEILEATRRVTGGRLRWGLSAAGHLSPEIFRFFHRQGIELMSGFGMTEATGGITMTPPGEYRDESLGRALPGIELKQAEDGELLVRGPYVMLGYLDPPDGARALDADGWFHTGDVMEMDSDGYIRLVDRKKEIYKNIKGETIAPQRIENLFRDFESVGRAFVVGDHREFNTALIYPNPAYREAHLKDLSCPEVESHFRSIVVSVNTFLAPYERIVDFAILDRDLDPDRGELTPKLTPRRSVVERNFADAIGLLYRRTDLRVSGVTLTFPNWVFQALGLTAQDIEVRGDRVTLPSTGASLTVRRKRTRLAQVGSCLYRHADGPLNLGALLSTPRLWLGNDELVGFVPLESSSRERPGRAGDGIEWAGIAEGSAAPSRSPEAILATLREDAMDILDLHRAAVALLCHDEELAMAALHVLGKAVDSGEGSLQDSARLLLARAAGSPVLQVRRAAFRCLAPVERDSRFASTLRSFSRAPGILLDVKTREAMCARRLSDEALEALEAEALEACLGSEWKRSTEQRATSLLRFLSAYGAMHPTRYRRIRAFLVRTTIVADRSAVRRAASRALAELQAGFREWLGPLQRMAVDSETGHEYGWEDVVVFEDGIEDEVRHRILSAIRGGAFLREAVFLFSGGVEMRLSDVPPGGVWIRHLGTKHGKSVYRATLQTRLQGSFDLAINVNRSLDADAVQEEIRWLILCGEGGGREPLVEDFGGFWSEQNLWSEEFIAGETLEHAVFRLSRNPSDGERLRQMWPFFAWSSLAAHLDFWHRTGRSQVIRDPGLENVIVPTHDYQTGARIVSISARRPYEGLLPMLRSFHEDFLRRRNDGTRCFGDSWDGKRSSPRFFRPSARARGCGSSAAFCNRTESSCRTT